MEREICCVCSKSRPIEAMILLENDEAICNDCGGDRMTSLISLLAEAQAEIDRLEEKRKIAQERFEIAHAEVDKLVIGIGKVNDVGVKHRRENIRLCEDLE